jgi:hypothetical protein
MALVARNKSEPYRIWMPFFETEDSKVLTNTRTSSDFGNQVQNGFINTEYRQQIARNTDASTAYTRIAHNFSPIPVIAEGRYWSPVYLRHYDRYSSKCMTGGITPLTALPTGTHITACDDIALKRIKGKLARDEAHFKSLVPIGEIKELKNLVRSTAETTEDFLKSAGNLFTSTSKGRALKKLTRAASRAWLNYSFAISPTVGMISDIAESINATLNRDHHIKLYGQKTVGWTDTLPGVSSFMMSGACDIIASNVQRQHRYSCRYTAGFAVAIQSLVNYGQIHAGLTASEVFSTAYQLTPFSWVLDYFSTTGDALEDFFQAPSGTTYFCTKSVKYLRQSTVSLTPRKSVSAHAKTSLYGASVTQTAKEIYFSRSVLGSLPHRSFRFKTPDETVGINVVNKLLNLASVLGAK